MRYRIADGAKLRSLRLKRQMRQVELAKMVDVLASTLCNIEGGAYQPSDLLAHKLAAALDCEPEDFSHPKGEVDGTDQVAA